MEGGCECGGVRYRMSGDQIFVNCCHCRQCQKLSGSAFALNAMIERQAVEITAGETATHEGQAHCAKCLTLLWATHRMFGDGILFLRIGTLDEGERLAPNVHFFVRSKHPWVAIPEGAKKFETLPAEGDPPLLDEAAAARIEAARRG